MCLVDGKTAYTGGQIQEGIWEHNEESKSMKYIPK